MRTRSVALAITTALALASASVPARASESIRESSGTQRILGLVVANAGLVGFAAGVVTGRDRQPRAAGTACSTDVCGSMASLLVADFRAQNDRAFQLMTLGALAMATGVAVYLVAPDEAGKPSGPSASFGIGTGGLTFTAAF